MSLLTHGTELVTVFPEEVTTDMDGNLRTRASAVGVLSRAVISPVATPVTSVGGTSESQNVGFESGEQLSMRLVGWKNPELGAQAQVEWQGRRYGVFGEPKRYNGSARTAHTLYYLKRT